jgi:hypothetical protein
VGPGIVELALSLYGLVTEWCCLGGGGGGGRGREAGEQSGRGRGGGGKQSRGKMVGASKEMAVYCFDTLVAHYTGDVVPAPGFEEGQL